MYKEKPNILVGKVVTAVYLSDDNHGLKFEIEGGEPIISKTDADCCSHTWIENVENPEAAVGSILVAESISMPGGFSSEDHKLACYGFKIETSKGTCIIDYRNSSNGYYGGNLRWPNEDPDEYNGYYGGVFSQSVPSEVWKKIAPL